MKVGDGSRTRFLHDIWCGDRPLKVSLPDLLCLAWNRDATVVDLGSISNDTTHWDINFTSWCMIGRWTPSPLSSMFCIPLE